jgi:4'-phosphopantetheinyl transferase EntD
MDSLALRFAPLTTTSSAATLALLDLDHLRPLVAQEEHLCTLRSLLSPDEARIFAGFAYPKRRLEWLGGRLAAKHCLAALREANGAVSIPCSSFSLLPDASGRPYLASSGGRTAISVSISHSRGYAAALATTTGSCGIDIQHKTDRLHSVRERFAPADELALLQGLPDPLVRLAVLWTAKEAVKKCCLPDTPTLFERISLTAMTDAPETGVWIARCRVRDQRSAEVRIMEFGEYLVAATMGGAHA